MYVCPLCMKTEYLSLDSLCFELTKVTIKHIRCPICAETILGLDKYTIHLYSHLLQKEKLSKNKAKSETATLNVLVKNMCKALDPQGLATQNKSQSHVEKSSFVKIAKTNEIDDHSRFNGSNSYASPKKCGSNSHPGAFFHRVEEMDSQASNYSGFKLYSSLDDSANVIAKKIDQKNNFSSHKGPASYLSPVNCSISDNACFDKMIGTDDFSSYSGSKLFSSPKHSEINDDSSVLATKVNKTDTVSSKSSSELYTSPKNCRIDDHSSCVMEKDNYDVSIGKNSVITAPNLSPINLDKSTFESSSNIVLSFASSDLNPSIENVSTIISHNVSAYSPPMSNDTRTLWLQGLTIPQKSTLTKGESLSTSAEANSPKLYIMLPETPSIMNIGPNGTAEISQVSRTNSELMTIDTQELQLVTNVEPIEAEPRTTNSSPFEFEEFIKLNKTEKSAETHKCNSCSFSFPDVGILKMHNQLVHNQNSLTKLGKKMYCCQYCNKGFKMKGSLLVHHRVAHKHILPNWENSSRPKRNEGEESPTQVEIRDEFKCTVCSKTFKKEQFLSQHLKTHESKQWECDVCTKSFTTKYFLKKHKRLHTGDQRYFCELCKKAFTFQQSYHKHVLYHSDEKPYPCATCGRAFKELSTLHNHERIHTGEKPYFCETCGKNFRQRISCLVHSRIHTGAMPYQCTACNKKFRYKCSEKSHKCPVSPPGQIVLCDTEKKSKSLLSSIKKRLSANERNLESCPSTAEADKQATEHGANGESKESSHFESGPAPPPQYLIMVPVAPSGEAASDGTSMSAEPAFGGAATPQNASAPGNHAPTRVDVQNCGSDARFGAPFSSALPISAPDFFSDPAELFSSLTFSP